MSNYYEGTECPRHGWSSNNAYKECPHCKKEDIEIADLKAKYQKAVEDAEKYKSERDFIKEYLNPADLSFRYMIDAFKVLPVEKQDKLIALAKSLSELGEKE